MSTEASEVSGATDLAETTSAIGTALVHWTVHVPVHLLSFGSVGEVVIDYEPVVVHVNVLVRTAEVVSLAVYVYVAVYALVIVCVHVVESALVTECAPVIV